MLDLNVVCLLTVSSSWLYCSGLYLLSLLSCSFLLRLPENLPLDASAPLLCAGITTYSPIKHYGLDKPGTKLGVIGLGGLGHMAVKIGKAMGLEVSRACSAHAKCGFECKV